MKKYFKIAVILFFGVFFVAGSAMAFPYIEVVGVVAPYAATWIDNGDNTTTLKGLEYTFHVTDNISNASMKTLSLEFETDVFKSVSNPISVNPTDWTFRDWSSSDSYYEVAFAGTPINVGQSLTLSIDVIIFNAAFTDAALWGEGQIWGQSFTAMDTLGGGDGGSTAPVPEPATMLLLGSGLIGLAGMSRKKFFKK